MGVFASRSPNRPNGLGLSVVQLLAIEPGVLRVAGVDAVDGTPVYDVKPYLPWTEAIPDARSDWAPEPPSAADERRLVIAPEFEAKLGGQAAQLVRGLLRLELEPAYHDTADREYGMTVSGWNVRWRARRDGTIEVIAVEPR